MRTRFFWVMALAGSGVVAAACGQDDSNRTELSRPAGLAQRQGYSGTGTGTFCG